jgi:3-isopropylmalate dehydrogenase
MRTTAGGRVAATIAVLPGDGVGPEVCDEAVRVLRAVAEKGGHDFTFQEALLGGAAIDAVSDPLPSATLDACLRADAILMGAVGGPKWGPSSPVRPEQGLLRLRQELGVYANLRPVTVHPRLLDASPLKPGIVAGVDLLVVRELTGGIYFGAKRRDGDRAYDDCSYSVDEIARVVRVAGRLARGRRGHLTQVDKANVLETSRLWREVTDRIVRDEFPDLRLDHQLVDSCAMLLVRRPLDFDVIVTENLFGDILTDEAAVISGSIGMLPSASLGDGTRGLYEPIHGSAPDIAGRGIANPCGTILSAAMLLRHSLGLADEASAVEAAVHQVIDEGAWTPDLGGTARTRDVGEGVVRALRWVA